MPLSAYILVAMVTGIQMVASLDNGVARTPPMGWLSWERFECNTDCDGDPDNCISEYLYKKMADIMVTDGYLAAGYQYVDIDDCWLSKSRDSEGRLQADPVRFPSGIKGLADYMHAKGLKLGVYGDVGTRTCAGFPGSEGYMHRDAQTLADWGVDMLKFDGCNADLEQFENGFPKMGRALNATGRHIVYSCEWPMYEKAHGGKPDYARIAATCNVFRQLTDIYDSWGSVLGMIEYFGDDPGNFSLVAGPGAWNDPDQLVIGNFGLSRDQEKFQMAMWCMLASPLLFSVDLKTIPKWSKDLLQNPRLIAINQDTLGIQAKRIVNNNNGLSIWIKAIEPLGSRAIAFMYTKDHGYPLKVAVTLYDIGLAASGGYDVEEVFSGSHLGKYKPWDVFVCYVNPTGVYLITAKPL